MPQFSPKHTADPASLDVKHRKSSARFGQRTQRVHAPRATTGITTAASTSEASTILRIRATGSVMPAKSQRKLPTSNSPRHGGAAAATCAPGVHDSRAPDGRPARCGFTTGRGCGAMTAGNGCGMRCSAGKVASGPNPIEIAKPWGAGEPLQPDTRPQVGCQEIEVIEGAVEALPVAVGSRIEGDPQAICRRARSISTTSASGCSTRCSSPRSCGGSRRTF